MGANATSALPAVTPEAHPRVEARQTGGVTTRLILDYVEREGGREAVERLLRSRGLEAREQALRNEDNWCSYATKIAMLEAAAEVLDDPLAARHIGEAGMDFNIAPGLKLSLRALGSLRLLYKNIPRTCSKFTSTHRMEALEIGRRHARIAYTDISGTGYHPADCELNQGFLSCAPILFGLPLARVSHPVCARDGGDTCVYELRWQSGASRLRTALAAAGASAAALGGAIMLDPALIPEAFVAAAGFGGVAVHGELGFRRRRLHDLQGRADQQAQAADRLATSLQDLVSALKLDEVLAKIRKNAQVAVGGNEFALLVHEADGMRCKSSSTLPRESIAALEAWAASAGAHGGELPTLLDDLSQVPALQVLPRDRALPLRSLCSAPLVFRGRSLGVLVALANAEGGFLPHDVELLQSYAAQAAIALENARLYEAQEQLASRDPLTGLHNHREFHEAIARELEECRRHGGSMAVVLLDLDDFKRVNDTSGHAAGDSLLLAVAAELSEACRASDQAFRIGGDEFALLLPRSTRRDAIPVGERAVEAMTRVDPRVSVSYGIAEWPADGPAKDSLLRQADERLYAMKRSAAAGSSRHAAITDDEAAAATQRERLACANRLSARLAPLLEPDHIVTATVDELQESFGYHLTVILRADSDGRLRAVGAAGPLAHELPDIEVLSLPDTKGIAGRVARSGEPALVQDTGRDPHYVPTAAPTESGSELAVAIRVAGRVWGVLNLEQLATNAFDADDVVFADLVAAHVGAALDRTRLSTELEGTFMTTLAALSDALEHKDAYTAAHAREVEDLTERVGARLGLAGEELRTVRYAALLHDIGKIGIPSEILNKPDKLTDEEFEQIKQHTVIGARMLERIPFFAAVHPLVRSAHERWDGRGYPDALAASDIPLGARIICACDAFHAMTSDRAYRTAMPVAEAIAELRRWSGRQFDPAVVDALVVEATADLGRF